MDKGTGSGQKAMSVEKPHDAEQGLGTPLAKQKLFASPAPKQQLEKESWDWGWGSWGWSCWGQQYQNGWWHEPAQEDVSRYDLRRAPSSVSEASLATTTASRVQAALNRAPTAGEKLDAIAEQGGSDIQEDLNRVFEALAVDDAAATEPSPEKPNPQSTRLTDGSVHIDQQDTQSFKTADQESLSGETSTAGTVSQESPPKDKSVEMEDQNKDPPKDLQRSQPLDKKTVQMIEEENKNAWKLDKRGQPLKPGALYQRFYRGARSALLHSYR